MRRNSILSLPVLLTALISAAGFAPVLAQADHLVRPVSYRCVVDTDIKSPDSLALGDFDDESSKPLADVTLDVDADFARQTLSYVKSDNNSGAPAAAYLELVINRQGDEIQAVVQTFIKGRGLEKEQIHLSVDFMNGEDPHFITHGYVSRDAGITEQVVTKKKRFFGLGEKTEITNETMKFSDAAFFDPLAGVDLQCALVTGKN